MFFMETDKEEDNIFIVNVVGNTSKTINIPDEFCKFCNIEQGDLIKLKLLCIIKVQTKKENINYV